MSSNLDVFEAGDAATDSKDTGDASQNPAISAPPTQGPFWRASKRPLKFASYGGDLKGRLLAPLSADTQTGGGVIYSGKGVAGIDVDLLPFLPFPRATLSRNCTSATADADAFSRQQRSDDFVELHSALTELSRLEGDEKFDLETIKSARAVLRKLFYSGTDAPKLTWLACEAIVLTWRRGSRVDALTIGADSTSLLRDGQFDEKLDGIAVSDEIALANLVQRILK